VNHLTIDALDPGAGTQETKACLVNVVKVRDAVPTPKTPRGRTT
jgi:formate dehydrogenase major subunit